MTQGNKHQHIDQNWEKMKQILDRELPQKKARRKWGLLWLFTIGIAVSVSAFLGIKLYTGKQTAEVKPEKTVSNYSKVQKPASKNQGTFSSMEEQEPAPQSNATGNDSHESSSATALKQTFPPTKNLNKPLVSHASNASNTKPDLSTVTPSRARYSYTSPFRRKPGLLPASSLYYLPGTLTVTRKKSITTPTGSLALWNLQLFAGGNTNSQLSSPLSYLHEIGIRFSRNMGVRTALFLDGSYQSKSIKPLQVNSSYNLQQQNGLISHTILDQRTFGELRSFGLSIGVSYHIRPKIRVGLGAYANINRKLLAVSQQTQIQSHQSNGTEVQPNPNLIRYQPLDLIRKTDMGAALELNYQINRTYVSLVYKQGLRDFTSNTLFNRPTNNYTQYLGLRLSYTLIQGLKTREFTHPFQR